MSAVEVPIEQLDAGAWVDELVAIEKRDGVLLPEVVAVEARNPASPLHAYFEWDDEAAASAFRVEQARRLIRRAEIVLTVEGGETRQVRAFLHSGERGYRSTATVMSKKAMREDVLARMRSDIEIMTARYERYATIPEVSTAMKALRSWLKSHGG